MRVGTRMIMLVRVCMSVASCIVMVCVTVIMTVLCVRMRMCVAHLAVTVSVIVTMTVTMAMAMAMIMACMCVTKSQKAYHVHNETKCADHQQLFHPSKFSPLHDTFNCAPYELNTDQPVRC